MTKLYVCAHDGACPMCNAEYAAVMRMDAADYGRWLRDRTCEDPSMTSNAMCRVVPGERRAMERADEHDVPPPPSLREAILARRAAQERLRELSRSSDRKLEVLPGVGENEHGVPNPPRLAARR